MPDTDTLIKELNDIADSLAAVAAGAKEDAVRNPLIELEKAAEDIGTAWSGSNIGYHARVYYKDYKSPPTSDMFSSEWGLMFATEERSWQILTDKDVRSEIIARAGNPDMQPLRDRATEALDAFRKEKEAVLSILSTYLNGQNDSYIIDLKEKVTDTTVRGMRSYGRAYLPTGTIPSRDTMAIDQGLAIAPHQQILAEVKGTRAPFESAQTLASYAKNAAEHMQRKQFDAPVAVVQSPGSRAFIGHGGSPQWRELKDYIQDQGVQVDEFNRVPVAGLTTVARLNDMLESAAIAFLVMTAEDEMAGGAKVARDNVIHEVGLFQGRLGFEKAIVMLEEGCDEFSNIHGLIQIRYPAGNISAKFHEVRSVLEREGLA